MMPRTGPEDRAASIRRARMIVAALASPRPRAALRDRLVRAADETGTAARAVGPGFDWIDEDGAVDGALLAVTAAQLKRLLSPAAILEVERMEELPSTGEERAATSIAIVRLVFARLGAAAVVSEAQLGAAIAMFTPDVAIVRRDAVDAGVLHRTEDGARYALVAAPPQTHLQGDSP